MEKRNVLRTLAARWGLLRTLGLEWRRRRQLCWDSGRGTWGPETHFGQISVEAPSGLAGHGLGLEEADPAAVLPVVVVLHMGTLRTVQTLTYRVVPELAPVRTGR